MLWLFRDTDSEFDRVTLEPIESSLFDADYDWEFAAWFRSDGRPERFFWHAPWYARSNDGDIDLVSMTEEEYAAFRPPCFNDRECPDFFDQELLAKVYESTPELLISGCKVLDIQG
jgi:hypothetical protein